MQKHYFEIGKVVSIIITLERVSEYRWAPAIPERPKKFLGIRIGTKPAVPAGWTKYNEVDDLGWAHYRRTPSSYFAEHPWHKVDEIAKEVRLKPHVEVRFGYKQSLGVSFETDADAQAWVDELIATSDKKFEVIINK